MTESELYLLKSHALGGDLEAQAALATAYHYGDDGLPQSYEDSVKWASLAAERHHPESCLYMGFYYQFGNAGLPQDTPLAQAYYLKAAERGVADAALGLAVLYLWDCYMGVSGRLDKAARYLRSGAKDDQRGCKYILGQGIRSGLFKETEAGESEQFLRDAAEDGWKSWESVDGLLVKIAQRGTT